MVEAKFKVSLKDGSVIEFEGSEAFVQKQLTAFDGAIRQALVSVKTPSTEARHQTKQPSKKAGGPNVSHPDGNPYENVFEFADGKVTVICDIGGKNNSAKSVNVALLHLLGKQMLDVNEVPTDEIRDACEKHGCLDSPNFMKSLKGAKTLMVVSGTGKKLTARLTVPGRKKAETLATASNEAVKN